MVVFKPPVLPTDSKPQLHPRSEADPKITIECRSLAEKTHVITVHLDGFLPADGYRLVNGLYEGLPADGAHLSYGVLKAGVLDITPAVDREGFHCAVNFTNADAARGLIAAASQQNQLPLRDLQSQLQQAASAKYELDRPRP